MAKLSELVTRTQQRLSMAEGLGVQVHAEDRIAEMIQHKFDTLFDLQFWPQFFTWGTYALDGTLGIVTTDLTTLIKDFEDIAVIFPESSEKALTKTTTRRNPFLVKGTRPLEYSGLAPTDANKTSRVFQIWPKAATGNIIIGFRTKPDTFEPEDEIDFDDQALILGATYDYLEDDGTNPNGTQKFQGLFENRVTQLERKHDSGPISLDPSTALPQTFGFTAL
jgi:hypothetical protein